MQTIFSADRIFTGNEWLEHRAIVVKDLIIESIIPLSDKIKGRHFENCSIVPGFIDVQVYGAAGKLLSAFPEKGTLEAMHDQFIKEGTVLCQPTVSTNTITVFKKCIEAIREYWSEGGQGIFGLHLEGPWLNKLKKGAHREEWIHAPTIEEVRDIMEFGKGVVKMVTLAPENCSQEVIKLIRSYGVIVSAGHSNATYEQAMDSFENGIDTVTHLYNAMSPLQHREPGLVGAAFLHPSITASVIPDGHHVQFEAIKLAKKLMKERLFAITDAVTETVTGPYQHHLEGDKYVSDGVLSGSAKCMHTVFKNLVFKAGIDETEALKMCTLYPALVLRADQKYGRIAQGCIGRFIVLDEKLELVEVL